MIKGTRMNVQLARSMQVTYVCPHCLQTTDVSDVYGIIGMTVECGLCGWSHSITRRNTTVKR